MTNALKNRLWVGLGLLCVLLAALYAGQTVFFVFVMGMLLFAGFEWGILAGLGNGASLVYAAAVGIMSITGFGLLPYMSYVVMAVVVLMVWQQQWTVLAGIMVLPYIFATLVLLTDVSEALYGIWWLAVVYVWAAVIVMDSGAYFVGKTFGKNLLCPRISPGKTWEGFFGGLMLTLLAAAGVYLFAADILALQQPFIWVAGTGIIAVFAQLGDVCESQMKRRMGVKDSGTLLYQHGGVLDRIDGLMGALIITRVLLEVVLL